MTDLERLTLAFTLAIQTLMEHWRDHDVTLDEWEEIFLALLAQYLSASLMLGLGTEQLNAEQQAYVTEKVNAQKGYLDGFKGDLAQGWQDSFLDRAELYASAVTTPYWRGKTWKLELPALPGDGSTECLQWCKCHWDIQDLGGGNFDCYWVLGEAEHCPTCTLRADKWIPYRIRA